MLKATRCILNICNAIILHNPIDTRSPYQCNVKSIYVANKDSDNDHVFAGSARTRTILWKVPSEWFSIWPHTN